MSIASYLARRSLHYGWLVAGLTFLALLVAAGIRATPSVLIVPLEHEFGWSRATISLAISINLILYGLIGPFAAAVLEQIGIRRTMVFALALLGVGVSLTTLMSASWQLVLLWGVVVGSGTGVIALVLGAVVVNRWFVERRGLVLGVLTASTATGQLVFLPMLASLVERFGWRSAVLTIAGVAVLIIPLIALLMRVREAGALRHRPSQVGLRAFGDHSETVEVRHRSVNPIASTLSTLRLGMRRRDFWLLSGSFFICGASTNGLIGTHLIPACIDHGIPEIKAAGLLAVMGIFDFVGTTASGWLSDRWNNRHLLFWYYGLRGLSLIFLPFSFDPHFYGLSIFAVFYGLDWIATVPPTVRLTTNVFGKEKAGVMFGWIVAAHQIGAATAAFGAGALRTWQGSYLQAFILSGILCLIAAVLVLRIDQRPNSRDSQLSPAQLHP
ncbi:major facilitator transporter [Scytonema sp. HK-05]|uniref:MFS transporter n=1 Tax=Scytonema sp. HK-05 TaxID=1137095 RepID=UPI0009375EB9|nr:MFS transporter [Scytonema sp. HK-05]OKH59310.1 MFS transporter [Scytonema sp. HK-05]BAY46214.1 major facilitator transporter [Scytonema sp. HK-05]